MGRYSTDSDSDRSSRHRRRHHRRSRSSSSYSSDSSSYRKRSKYSKSRRRRRSPSRSRDTDRSSRSHKSSRDRDRRHVSPESKSHASDRSKRKGRSVSREKSTSRSSSSQSNLKAMHVEERLNFAKNDDVRSEPKIKDSVLDEINSEKWVPKQFTSSAQNKPIKSSNIVIDITADTIKIPPVLPVPVTEDSIFHSSISLDQDVRFDRWVKKFYTLRQKAITELNHSTLV